MASDQQVALARTHRGGSNNLTKVARQVVPAFLQKLFEMVNDPSNNELIRWSESGDSFFVLDHERFAREVLGRWFKHQNFASFVRQLNMYGFHKIPHLQQGVLKSEPDTEFWNFEHPSFHRGQPDLLCLIQRKKQTAQVPGVEDHFIEAKDPNNPVAPAGSLSAGQLLDINTIVSGISVIKRHQTAISADLNDLKTSNQQLWQEALAARERHKKQQDTINRILKFLAGVFGQGGTPKHEGSNSPPAMMPSRKRQRLMIGDGRDNKGDGKARAVEMIDVEDDDDEMETRSSVDIGRDQTPFSAIQFASIDTPMSGVTPSEGFSPAAEASMHYPPIPAPNSSTPATPDSMRGTLISNTPPMPIPDRRGSAMNGLLTQDSPVRTNGAHPMGPSQNISDHDSVSTAGQMNDLYSSLQMQQQQQGGGPSFSPSAFNSLTTTANGHANSDAMMQAAFQHMMNSPSQMQRFFQALASQSNYPFPPPSDQQHPSYPQQSSQVASYEPMPENSLPYRAPTPGGPMGAQPLQLLYSPPKPEDSGAGIVEPLMSDDDRINKTYKDAAEIDADVDALQTSIYSLIENLGLDPTLINTQQIIQDAGLRHGSGAPVDHQSTRPDPSMPPPPSMPDSHVDSSAQDFDFDAFLTEFSRDNDTNADIGDFAEKLASQANGSNLHDPSPEQLTAFLDEVASNASEVASPSLPRTPELHPSRTARKRKSDAVSIGEQSRAGFNQDISSLTGAKSKRKK